MDGVKLLLNKVIIIHFPGPPLERPINLSENDLQYIPAHLILTM